MKASNKSSKKTSTKVSEIGCEISVLRAALSSNPIKSWAIWSNTEISLVLGMEWGPGGLQRSLLPFSNLWLSHSIPPVPDGASWTRSAGLHLVALHELIPFYEFVCGVFWNIKTSATHHFGAKFSAACVCCQLPPSVFVAAACFLGCLLPPVLWNKINGSHGIL